MFLTARYIASSSISLPVSMPELPRAANEARN
jgi:hypothetical protein